MTLEPIQYLLGALSGSLVGFTLGLVGGGGSILAVPLMVYLVRVPDAHLAIGTFSGQGHAWVEGQVDGHFFMIEATTGQLYWIRPYNYRVILFASQNGSWLPKLRAAS